VVGCAGREVRVEADDVGILVPLPGATALGLLGRFDGLEDQAGSVFELRTATALIAAATTGSKQNRPQAGGAAAGEDAASSGT